MQPPPPTDARDWWYIADSTYSLIDTTSLSYAASPTDAVSAVAALAEGTEVTTQLVHLLGNVAPRSDEGGLAAYASLHAENVCWNLRAR